MRLVLVTAWVLAGAAVTAGAYWGFLITPESTIGALALQAVLAVIAVALLSITINGAIIVWANGSSVRALKRTFPRIPSIVPALLVFALSWWIAYQLDTWVALRSGGINAWFIARFGWDDVSWFFTGIRFFTMWLRWVLGALLAISLIGGIAAIGWRAGVRPQWIRRAMRPRALLAATLWFVVLIALPWTYLVPWRPGWVPPTGAELAFIIAKLSIAAIVMAAGVALIINEATRVPFTPIDPEAQRIAA
jgi:hypothetical protein